MTIIPPEPGEPRRPHGPLNKGDAWVVSATGEKYWGRYGAAGLLAFDAQRGVLLQHRVGWSHFGGTWGIPGGALHEGESALQGALREAHEEAGIPGAAVRSRFTRVLDLGIWSYTTVVADVVTPFDPVISDPESLALEWVPVEDVDHRPLHPGFAGAWPRLRALLEIQPTIVVDAANVVGSVPDGWWKDRAGAAARLGAKLSAWTGAGVRASALGLDADRWYPPVSMVVEGEARAVPDLDAGDDPGAEAAVADGEARAALDVAVRRRAPGRVEIVRAVAGGDDAIVDETQRLIGEGHAVIVITSDRGLRARAEHAGARVEPTGWLTGQFPG